MLLNVLYYFTSVQNVLLLFLSSFLVEFYMVKEERYVKTTAYGNSNLVINILYL